MGSDKYRTVDLVMEGGGVKGVALVGALAVLEDRGYRWANLAGTSAGAIVAVLAAAGYTAYEMRDILRDLEFNDFMDSDPRWLPHKTRAAYNLVAHWGMYKGKAFVEWMRTLLAAKGVHTFGDLKRGIPDRENHYRVRIVASDVTRGRMIVLPEDIRHYGMDPDKLDVACAVRMSMSIPGFFRPVTLYSGWPDGHEQISTEMFKSRISWPQGVEPCYIVDGALLSNFPIRLFDGEDMDNRPTFGLRMIGRNKGVAKFKATSIISYAMSIALTAVSASDTAYLDAHNFLRTIEIDNLGTSATNFDLTSAEKTALYDSGVSATREFLETWDFDEWRASYATWAGASRRKLVKAALEHEP